MMTDYKPISCDYHDFLLAKATLKEVCQIEYLSEKNQLIEIQSIIYDIYTKKGEEFIVFDHDLTIRLDKIQAVNGVALTGFTCNNF